MGSSPQRFLEELLSTNMARGTGNHSEELQVDSQLSLGQRWLRSDIAFTH